MKGKLKKLFIIIVTLFAGVVFAVAESSYKNELTKVSLSPIGADDVKITLFMAKPYTEPLRLLRKNDSEFVLILPETYNSAPQKPSISDVIGEVTDADIKLYSFASNSVQNGYTKIVIKTNGLVNLYPEAVTTGGGTLVNKAQSDYLKLTQTTQPVKQTTPQLSQNVAAKTNKVDTPTKEQQKKEAQVKDKKVDQKTTENQKESFNIFKNIKNEVKQEKIKKDEVKKEQVKTVTNEEPKVAVNTEVEELSSQKTLQNEVGEITVQENENNLENDIQEVSLVEKINAKIASTIATIGEKTPSSEQTKNILVVLTALIVTMFSVKFAISFIKNIASQKEDETGNIEFDNINGNSQYSAYFKTFADTEFKNSNPFSTVETDKKENIFNINKENIKTQEEVLNEDQNLTWQEKFRALQKNKKSLLKEDETEKSVINATAMEITEDMHIENPIKKLKQEFKAVRNVLEKQKAAQEGKNNINQNFTPEKIDKIEVISFEDFQKKTTKSELQPKVQMKTTSPIKAKAPNILTQLNLGNDKGFYLVDYRDKIEFVGYIKDKVFRLNSYNVVRNSKIYARMTEKVDGKETYIVKFDNNKMLVDVCENDMALKLMY